MHIKFIARGESNEFPVQTTANSDDDDGQQHVKERQQRKTENLLECRAANATKKTVKMKPNKIITKKGAKKKRKMRKVSQTTFVSVVSVDGVKRRSINCLHVNYFNEFRFAGREKYER